jgi:hypothetical protein
MKKRTSNYYLCCFMFTWGVFCPLWMIFFARSFCNKYVLITLWFWIWIIYFYILGLDVSHKSLSINWFKNILLNIKYFWLTKLILKKNIQNIPIELCDLSTVSSGFFITTAINMSLLHYDFEFELYTFTF